MLAVLVDHVLGFLSKLLEFGASLEVLDFAVSFDQVITSVETVFDLNEVELSILNVSRNTLSGLTNGLESTGILGPVVAFQFFQEVFSRFVMGLNGGQVLLHVAGD